MRSGSFQALGQARTGRRRRGRSQRRRQRFRGRESCGKPAMPYSAGRSAANTATNTSSKTQVNRSATTPASRPSRALSVNNCRIRRNRLAPSERRMQSSFWRDAARASCRLATLAQATTSTIPTATMMSRMANRNPPYSLRGGGTESRPEELRWRVCPVRSEGRAGCGGGWQAGSSPPAPGRC